MGTAACHRRAHLAYCDDLPGAIERLAAIAEQADHGARAPTCPDWSVGQLLEHVGSVHRWAANHVAVLSPVRIPGAQMSFDVPGDPTAFPEWLREGGDHLVRTLRDPDPDAEMWAWGSDKHARFWSRRMLHETAVHRADAEIAAGLVPALDAADARDGIDEFLDNLPHAAYFAPKVELLRGDGRTLRLRATDGAPSWLIGLFPERFDWNHADDAAEATVEASAGELLLFVYGRRAPGDPGVRASGDRALLDDWIANSSI